MRRYLANADFRRLATGAAWHSASFQGEQVLVGLLVYRLTGSTAWVGAAYALAFLPMLLVGVPAGASADRFDRRALLWAFELALMVSMAAMAVAFHLEAGSVALVLTVTFLNGVVRAMQHPARLSYAHDLLGRNELVGALSTLSVTSRLGQLIGALVAGSLIDRAGVDIAYAALACMHGLGLVTFLRLKTSGRSLDAGRQSLRENLSEYFHELRHNPTLGRLTLLASAIEIFGFSFATALPELASQRLGVGAEGLGLLHGARSVGGLVGALVLVRLGQLARTGFVYLLVVSGFGLAVIILSLVPNLPVAMLAAGAVAACASACDVLVQTMMQLCVADRLRGRAMGAWVLALGAGPVGHVEIGVLAGFAGAGVGLAVNGGVLLLIGLVALATMGQVRRL